MVEIKDKSIESIDARRLRLRLLKQIVCGLLILLILIVGIWAWVHHSIQQRLDEALAELDRSDPGWRLLEIEAAREQIPAEENSARVVIAVAKLLSRNWQAPEFLERFTHLHPEEQLAPEDSARLKQELEFVLPALKEARKLSKMPRGRYRIVYQRNPLNTLLNDQQSSRQVVGLLLCDALQCAQRQDMNGALTACQAALNAARSLGDEPLSDSQLVRSAGVTRACQGIERALAQGEPAEGDVLGIQKSFDEEEAFPDLLIAARGERAMWHEMFEAMESGDISIWEMTDVPPSWKERNFGIVDRDNVRGQHPAMLAMLNRWIDIARLAMPEQIEAEQLLNRQTEELSGRILLAVLPLTIMPTIDKAFRRKHALLRCTIAALAAERYRLKHKKWPDSLERLCPQFLAAVPLDPFDGKPLRFRRIADGVVIYSISSDRVDNNGHLDRVHPDQPGVDIGFRLWDVAKRRQPPQPKAIQEEKPR